MVHVPSPRDSAAQLYEPIVRKLVMLTGGALDTDFSFGLGIWQKLVGKSWCLTESGLGSRRDRR